VIRTESTLTRNTLSTTTMNAVNYYYDLEKEGRQELVEHKKDNVDNYIYSSLKSPY